MVLFCNKQTNRPTKHPTAQPNIQLRNQTTNCATKQPNNQPNNQTTKHDARSGPTPSQSRTVSFTVHGVHPAGACMRVCRRSVWFGQELFRPTISTLPATWCFCRRGYICGNEPCKILHSGHSNRYNRAVRFCDCPCRVRVLTITISQAIWPFALVGHHMLALQFFFARNKPTN